MKTLTLSVLSALLVVSSIFVSQAKADTFVAPDGVVFSNICRYGVFFSVYPIENAQPLGTSCAILNGYGVPIGYGLVSVE